MSKNKYNRNKFRSNQKEEVAPSDQEAFFKKADVDEAPVEAENVATKQESALAVLAEVADLAPVVSEEELLERVAVEEDPVGFPAVGHDFETTPLPERTEVKEPVVDEIQNESDSIGRFKVTSVRAHVFTAPHLHSRPITAVVRGNMLPFFSEDLENGWYEVSVFNHRREKVRGFIELIRGKVIS